MSAISSSTITPASTLAASTTACTTCHELPAPLQRAIDFLAWTPVSLASGALFSAGTTAIAAGLFTAVSPLGGAVFGVSHFATGKLVSWLCEKFDCCPTSPVSKVVRFAFPLIAGIGAGCAAIAALGFALTPWTVIALTLGSAGVGFVGAFAGALVLTTIAVAYVILNGQNNAETNPNTATTSTSIRV